MGHGEGSAPGDLTVRIHGWARPRAGWRRVRVSGGNVHLQPRKCPVVEEQELLKMEAPWSRGRRVGQLGRRREEGGVPGPSSGSGHRAAAGQLRGGAWFHDNPEGSQPQIITRFVAGACGLFSVVTLPLLKKKAFTYPSALQGPCSSQEQRGEPSPGSQLIGAAEGPAVLQPAHRGSGHGCTVAPVKVQT